MSSWHGFLHGDRVRQPEHPGVLTVTGFDPQWGLRLHADDGRFWHHWPWDGPITLLDDDCGDPENDDSERVDALVASLNELDIALRGLPQLTEYARTNNAEGMRVTACRMSPGPCFCGAHVSYVCGDPED